MYILTTFILNFICDQTCNTVSLQITLSRDIISFNYCLF